VVLTATAGVTRYRDARRTAQLLQQSGIEIVVGILVPPPSVRRWR
jgi:Mrp family chromosome partitioning ATPase